MADFTVLKRELRKQLDKTKDVQEIGCYMIGKTKTGFLVTTTLDGEEVYVCTL